MALSDLHDEFEPSEMDNRINDLYRKESDYFSDDTDEIDEWFDSVINDDFEEDIDYLLVPPDNILLCFILGLIGAAIFFGIILMYFHK